MQADVVIVGAGPAGIFTALEMLRKGSRQKIVMVEKGQAVENRRCPKNQTHKCVGCKPYCHITTGFSGAGAFSDGKLSLSYEVGGDLPALVGEDLAQETIHYADSIYLEFGADAHIEGLEHEEERKEIRRRAIQAGLKLVDCPIRHMGTEKAQAIYYAIEQYLLENGVEIYFGYECSILCSHNFSVPFNQPIAYAQKVGELTNMLANGQILVQRFGDILDGKRTWQKELAQSNIRPTLPDAVAGDITAAMPYRAMTNIINFIQAMDYVVPGFAAHETLLYSPELKFYSNRVKMDTAFNTSLQGLHCLGDSSGWTRGLMMASVMGVLMGRRIAEEG